MNNKSVLPDENSLRLIPDDWWLLTGTVRGGASYNVKQYEREWNLWIRQIKKQFVKTKAELLWFYRIEKSSDYGMGLKGEWHIHFIFSSRHIKKQVEEAGGLDAAVRSLKSLWPSAANKLIVPYIKSVFGTNEWGSYINKVTQHDRIETFTKFSQGLKKEIIRRRKKLNTDKTPVFFVSSSPTE